jgi:hypothetical protein
VAVILVHGTVTVAAQPTQTTTGPTAVQIGQAVVQVTGRPAVLAAGAVTVAAVRAVAVCNARPTTPVGDWQVVEVGYMDPDPVGPTIRQHGMRAAVSVG